MAQPDQSEPDQSEPDQSEPDQITLAPTFAIRRRLAWLVLVFAAAWPAAQHLVSVTWFTNPWRYAGFAMYATPDYRREIELHAYDRNHLRQVLDPAGAPWEDAYLDYQRQLRQFGTLASPRTLRAAIRRARPDITHIDVITNIYGFGGDPGWQLLYREEH